MNNSSTVIFIIIAVVIFIVRAVAEAAKKKRTEEEDSASPADNAAETQAQRPQSSEERIGPLHFEIKEKEDALARKQAAAKRAAALKSAPIISSLKGDAPNKAAKVNAAPPPAAAGQGGFPLNVAKLSPLQQAVVMAEILGKPKGLD